MVLAVDLDGVIHDTQNVLPGYKMGQPIAGAVEALQQLHNQGVRIVVHTIWATSETANKAIKNWLDHFKVPYDLITSMKPRADYYIDDHGYRFYNWKQTLEDISGAN